MTDLTNIFARSIKDLTLLPQLPNDLTVLDQVKIPVGNLPVGLNGCEALTIQQIKDLAAAGRKEELDAVTLKISTEEIRAKEVEATLIKDKANKAVTLAGYGITDGYTQGQIDSKVNNLESKKADKIYVDQLVINANNGITNYQTQAALLAFTPTTANYTAKALDTKKVWLWDGVQWNDTGLSELDLSKKYVDEKTLQQSQEAIFQVEDSAGLVSLQQNSDGHLIIPHIEGSIQDNINSLNENTGKTIEKNILEVVDESGNITLRQSEDGDLHWAGSDKSLNASLKDNTDNNNQEDLVQITDKGQDAILAKINCKGDLVNSLVREGVSQRLESGFLSPKSKVVGASKRFLIRDDALQLINSNRALLSSIPAPVPLEQVPLNYTPPLDLVNLSVAQPEPTIIATTYLDDDGMVHPYLTQFYSKFNGCKYWLAITGFRQGVDYRENPFVFGSNNLVDFKLFDDYPQPLAEKPSQTRPKELSYNSDTFNFYDFQSGEFCVGWRTSHYLAEETIFHTGMYFKSTKDGIHWSDVRMLLPSSTDNEKLLSPTIIYDFINHKYLMFAVDPVNPDGTGRKEVVRYESRYLGDTWINKTIIDTPREFLPWHLEAKYLGDSIVLLVNDIYQAKNNFLGISRDNGVTFTFGSPIIEEGAFHSYKISFTPVINEGDNTISLTYMWNSSQFNKDNGTDDQWLTFCQSTNSINL